MANDPEKLLSSSNIMELFLVVISSRILHAFPTSFKIDIHFLSSQKLMGVRK